MTWKVYLIEAENGKLYTGITTDLKRRLSEHMHSSKGAKFFLFSAALKLVYEEDHENRSEASKREYAIKKMTRAQKLELISKQNKTQFDKKS